jgi:anthranilate synthase/phosphoribosyltransferase
MILLIDNYDSFTYNLVQALETMKQEVAVYRNDQISIKEIEKAGPSCIVISPGPGTPAQSGISVGAIRHFGARIPILGVCLGHQAVAAAYGGNVVRADRIMHGKTSRIFHDGHTIYKGLPNPFKATRYHSLIVERKTLPDCLKVSAWTEQGEIMGIRHLKYNVEGVQFHPESILTSEGPKLLENFSNQGGRKMIKEYISKVVSGEDLSEVEMENAMDEIMSGNATPSQIAAFVTALRLKGETIDEIAGAARTMRAKAVKICLDYPQGIDQGNNGQKVMPLLDTCGTGGDGARTFNVSTATAFVAAGGGVKVAKHGNRAVSSSCGSADVLEKLGVKLDVSSADVERCIEEVGIGFLFAPLFHGAMKHAAVPRQEIGIRTIFNVLGPLTNPAGAATQVLGVYDPDLTEKMAHVLNKLGTKEAFVVCGEGTFDEISICSPTKVSHLKDNEVKTFILRPEDYGFKKAKLDDIKGGDAQENALIIQKILNGEERGPKRDMVLMNAAAAFMAVGMDEDFKDGIRRAEKSLDSGEARKKLYSLIEFTQKC